MGQDNVEGTAGPQVSPAEKMRGKQWCDWGEHWFVPAFGHGDGELIWIDRENILVCNAHYAEACEEAIE